MRRRGHNGQEMPWVLVATVAGLVLVIIIALLFFSSAVVPEDDTTMIPAVSATTGVTLQRTTSPVTANTQSTPVKTLVSVSTTIPPTRSPDGVSIRVDYLGGFKGAYGLNGESQTVTSSGTRVYVLGDVTGTVSASFQKNDGTTKQALTVGIYKAGKLLNSGSTSSAFGVVNINAIA